MRVRKISHKESIANWRKRDEFVKRRNLDEMELALGLAKKVVGAIVDTVGRAYDLGRKEGKKHGDDD